MQTLIVKNMSSSKNNIFELAKEIKSSLIKKYHKEELKTYEDIISHVENSIKEKGFFPAFPTTISPDYRVSNWTPVGEQRFQELNFKICTIDFGIIHQGLILDNAITLTKQEYWIQKLDEYKSKIRDIERVLNKIYLQHNVLKGAEITEVVSRVFQNTEFTIIPECAAHKIDLNILHSDPILMCGEGVQGVNLKKGDYFTIEPHVTVGEGHTRIQEGTIFLDLKSNKYDTLDNRLNLESDFKKTILYSSVRSNKISFYEEDTYKLGDQLINCTRV